MARLSLAGISASAFLLSVSASFAQVTPEEVWQSWKSLSASVGQTVTTTSEARDGDTLVVDGVSMALDDGKGLVATSTIGTIRFRDTGSGTVEVTMPDSYPIAMTFPSPDPTSSDGPTSLTATISQPGMTITAGGSATETSYDFSAPSIGVAVSDIKNASGPLDVKFDIAMTGVSGRYLMGGPEGGKTLDSSFSATTAVVTGGGTDAGSTFNANISMENLAGTSKGTFVGVEMMENMAAALNGGFVADGGVSYGKTSFDISSDANGTTNKVTGTLDGGNVDFGLDKTRLKYNIGMKAANYAISGSDIPVPQVNLGFAEMAFNLLMPVAKGDAPQDFVFLTKLVDLTVSDDVWAMFDPTGQLPREPATLIIDTKGTVKLLADIMDPAAEAAMAGATPGEINSLDLNELRLKLAGAEVEGKGALTFDNTDMTTFQGVPAPTGAIDFKLTGINALLDTLVAMGIVPEDQVMGARMMLAMFAKPGDGPDTLVSTIEFKDKGLFANGQRLQ